MISLNRSSIVTLDHTTPLCVIEEIVKCMGMDITIDEIKENRDEIVKKVEEYDIKIEKKDEYEPEEIEAIAFFVSQGEESWEPSNLMRAFNHLLEFDGTIPESFSYGSKTNNNPLSYDVTMLYAFCQLNRIRTNSADTISELCTYVRLMFADREVLLNTLSTKLANLETSGLINILKDCKQHSKHKFVITKDTSRVLDKLKDVDNLFSRALLSDEEAIVYAAKNYNIDLSESMFPSTELVILSKPKPFKPIEEDEDFGINYSLNHDYYKLTRFWKPLLASLYTDKMLAEILTHESVDVSEISNPKQFMYELSLTKKTSTPELFRVLLTVPHLSTKHRFLK